MEYNHTDQVSHWFWAKVDTSAGPDGCWPFDGNRLRSGHVQFRIPARLWDRTSPQYMGCHRYAYEDRVGEIPLGYTIDHECHNLDKSCNKGNDCPHRACVNPKHLVARTLSENRKRANRPRPHYRRTRVEECSQGHPYNDENTGWLTRKSGTRAGEKQRYCLACNREKVYLAKTGQGRPADWNESLSRAGTPLCRRGHAYDEANTRYDSTTGKRRCRSCEAINDKASKARRRTQEPVPDPPEPPKG